jgi:hypothetical protein
MATYYVCSTYDEYDPITGLFNIKQDCIEWNEDLLGVWTGEKYSTKEECYQNSICSQPIIPQSPSSSNNWCGIHISNIEIINFENNSITISVQLPEKYYNTDLEYAISDINNNIISSFMKINNTSHLEIQNNYIISNNLLENSCNLLFRLVRKCDIGSESGSSEAV